MEVEYKNPCPRCGEKMLLVPGSEKCGGMQALIKCRWCGKQQMVTQLECAKVKASMLVPGRR